LDLAVFLVQKLLAIVAIMLEVLNRALALAILLEKALAEYSEQMHPHALSLNVIVGVPLMEKMLVDSLAQTLPIMS
jgi:hypothetical protein